MLVKPGLGARGMGQRLGQAVKSVQNVVDFCPFCANLALKLLVLFLFRSILLVLRCDLLSQFGAAQVKTNYFSSNFPRSGVITTFFPGHEKYVTSKQSPRSIDEENIG